MGDSGYSEAVWQPIEQAPRDGKFQWIGRDGDFAFADFMRWTGERWEFSDGSFLSTTPSYGNLWYHPLPLPPASAMSAFGQDPQGLEAQPASAAPAGGDAQ